MLDLAKGNLWILLILRRYKKKNINGSREREYLEHLEICEKNVKTDDLDDYATWRWQKTRIELKKTELGQKAERGD